MTYWVYMASCPLCKVIHHYCTSSNGTKVCACPMYMYMPNTVFMLIERMIQLPQENPIPGIVCILLEWKSMGIYTIKL